MSKKMEFFTIGELSEYLRISKNTLYRFTQEKRIPCFKVGVQLRFKKTSIDKWIADMEKTKRRKRKK